MPSSRWKSSTGRGEYRKQRLRVLARDGYVCQLGLPGCTSVATQADHKTPWIPGQIVPDSALQAACAHCNSAAGSPESRAEPDVELPSWL